MGYGGHIRPLACYSRQEAISHLQQNVKGVLVATSPTALRIEYEPCALGRAQQIISRCSATLEPATKPLERVVFDLIPLDAAYNDDRWVIHFKCYVTGMDFIYTHRKKSQAYGIVEEFLNMAKPRYNASVRFIRTDGGVDHQESALTAYSC